MLEKYKIGPENTVRKAIQTMDNNENSVIFIVDTNGILLGIFTQGDMRKFILENGDLTQNITKAMNPDPIVFHSVEEALEKKKKEKMVVYPVVDKNGKLLNAVFERSYHDKSELIKSSVLSDVPLVIMAGGKGTRLYPYTKILPKALVPIGDITITERIINNFRQFGCRDVYMILNHKANMIKAYFNELEKNYSLHFIEEKEFLGTGGGLQLLRDKINSTFILSNCDILIDEDIECIYKTHKQRRNKITFVCAMKSVSIPYGVINTDVDGEIVNMTEKPEFSFLTNTGIYVIEPEIIEVIEENEIIHFPDVAKRCMNKGERVGVFPIYEKAWLDMGEFVEMNKMMKAFE